LLKIKIIFVFTKYFAAEKGIMPIMKNCWLIIDFAGLIKYNYV